MAWTLKVKFALYDCVVVSDAICALCFAWINAKFCWQYESSVITLLIITSRTGNSSTVCTTCWTWTEWLSHVNTNNSHSFSHQCHRCHLVVVACLLQCSDTASLQRLPRLYTQAAAAAAADKLHLLSVQGTRRYVNYFNQSTPVPLSVCPLLCVCVCVCVLWLNQITSVAGERSIHRCVVRHWGGRKAGGGGEGVFRGLRGSRDPQATRRQYLGSET